MLATTIGFFALPLTAGNPVFVVVVLALAAAGIYGAVAVFWTIPSAYLSGSAAAGGIALISSIGGIGGFVSPSVLGWVKAATSSLYLGFDAIALVLGAGAILLLLGISAAVLSRGQK